MKNLLFVLALAFVLTGCTDHSRTFKLIIDASEDACVEIDIESLFEKMDNTEESSATSEAAGELSIPLVN